MMPEQLLAMHMTSRRADGLRPISLTHVDRAVRQLLRETGADPLTVTSETVAGWLANPAWTPWTRRTYGNAVRAFFGWLHAEAHRPDNPTARIKPARVPRAVPNPVTDEELERALRLAPVRPWRAAVLLAAYAGLRAGVGGQRAGEIARLQVEDVTEEVLIVRGGKGGNDGAVPTHPEIWAMVRSLPPGPVVRDQWGRPAKAKNLISNQHKVWRRLGMPEVHMHRFRHWYGTEIQRAQGDIRVTQELMRHVSITSTQIYTQVTSAQMVAAISSLGGRLAVAS